MAKEWPRPLSYSSMKHLAKSPAHIVEYWLGDFQPTKQMRIGSIWHKLSLSQPIKKDEYKKDEYELAETMQLILQKHELGASIIKQGGKEKKIIFTDPDFDFPSIAIPDVRIPELGIMADLKSAADVSFYPFRKSIYFFKYHWQGWWYLRSGNAVDPGRYHTFLIIAQETKPPYGVMVYKLSDKMLMDAEDQVRPLLSLFKTCLDTGEWPQYPEKIIEI